MLYKAKAPVVWELNRLVKHYLLEAIQKALTEFLILENVSA